MKLSSLQSTFAVNVALLILEMSKPPFTCTLGEAFRTSEQAAWDAARGIGIKDSQHCKRLAVDLMIFHDGVWCTDGESYRPFGEYWKTLNSLNRFGGDFARKDWVHFEMQEG
jgi:hypothetical protein